MSQRLCTGQLKQEWLLRRIRHSESGILVSPETAKSPELARLIRDRKVKLVRVRIKFDRKAQDNGREFIRPGARGTKAVPFDGHYIKGVLKCPECQAICWTRPFKHGFDCSLRTDHQHDRNRGPVGKQRKLAPFDGF